MIKGSQITRAPRVLITGGCGFIGSHFVRYLLAHHPRYRIVNLDKMTYAGNKDNLRDIEHHPHYAFVKGDINNPKHLENILKGIDYVVHFAAESHVDRSIHDPSFFVETNVLGTYHLLEYARYYGVKRFVHISTDEVYGSLENGSFSEKTPLAPNSPYSATKASSDFLVRSYVQTYRFPAVITRCSNNYGPYQYPEKLIPLMIIHALQNKPLPVYGDGRNVRDWLHVEDHCRAVDVVLHKGTIGEVYNIGGNNEWRNIDLVKLILKELGKPFSLIRFVKDRLGHDRRYAMDSASIRRELGWRPIVSFEVGIRRTIQWYVENQSWLERLKRRAERLSFSGRNHP